jgi:hypothetical protein
MALDPEPGSDIGAPLTGAPADGADPAAELVELPAADAGDPEAGQAAGPPPAAEAELAGQADEPGPPPPPVLVEPGRVYAYSRHDDYAVPPRVRHQLVLVIRVEGDGQVAGVPLAYADELAHFPAGELGPVDALDG